MEGGIEIAHTWKEQVFFFSNWLIRKTDNGNKWFLQVKESEFKGKREKNVVQIHKCR